MACRFKMDGKVKIEARIVERWYMQKLNSENWKIKKSLIYFKFSCYAADLNFSSSADRLETWMKERIFFRKNEKSWIES